jgi:Holliday junction resolvasome RuvABC endonuclease subunit
MRSAGVDIASVGFAAVSLAVNGSPVQSNVWKPNSDRDSDVVKLHDFFVWIERQLVILKPDIVAVEELAVFMNKKVIRSLAKREGVALLAAKRRARIVLSPSIKQSRAVVFEKGGSLSKEEAFARFKKQFPDFKVKAANQGGMDQADSMVHAIAAPVLLERR